MRASRTLLVLGTSLALLAGATTATAGGVAAEDTPDGGRDAVQRVVDPSDVTYVDVASDHPFSEEIYALTQWNVVTGWPDGTFRPTAAVTREAMAAFLYRFWDLAPGVPECNPADPLPFTDVTTGHPFCGAITWLADAGISTGYPDGTYHPGENVTREAMAAFIYRWWLVWEQSDEPMPTCDPATPRMFSDVDAGHPFCGAIEWLATNDITTGWSDGTFRPGQTIERQAMAAFLFRFDELL